MDTVPHQLLAGIVSVHKETMLLVGEIDPKRRDLHVYDIPLDSCLPRCHSFLVKCCNGFQNRLWGQWKVQGSRTNIVYRESSIVFIREVEGGEDTARVVLWLVSGRGWLVKKRSVGDKGSGWAGGALGDSE